MKLSYCLFVIFSILAVLHFPAVAGDACTDACDAQYTSGPRITFCSTAGITYTVAQAALQVQSLLYSSCYSQCEVNFLYPGACGCPNDCYAEVGHGACSNFSTVQCVCTPAWSGKDCSSIKCPSNTCSGHGTCVAQSSSKGGDYCNCQAGWTGSDCSAQVPEPLRNFGTLPYGEIASGAPYYQKDNYGDAHPFFNTSVVATVKITLTASDFASLLAHNTLYTQDFVPANLFFYNGVLSKQSAISFRIKGSSTRLNVKKSWTVKFPKGNAYKDLKGFALKSNIGDRVVTNHLVADLYRAMKAETWHTSMCELWINDVYYGLEALEEKLDDNWMKSRWNEDDTNMYKLGPYAMQYLGSDASAYSNYSVSIYDNQPQLAIEQEEGDGNFSDFAALVAAFNSSQTDLNTFIAGHFNLPVFMRAMVLETITKNADAYTGTGNNFLFYNQVELNNGGPNWYYIGIDYDVSMTALEDVFAPLFGLTGAQLKAILDSGVTNFYGVDLRSYIMYDNPYEAIRYAHAKPLIRAFDVPGANETFTQALRDFVNLIIVQNPGVTEKYRKAYYDMARPFVQRDKMFTIATGSGVGLFDTQSSSSQTFVSNRWAYLASLIYANGHGQCNANGVCACNSGYFGAACDTFCGVDFVQQQTNSWVSNGQTFTQWSVTVNVGSSPLYSAVFQVLPGNATSFAPWNINQVSGSTNLYTFPAWQYQNGALPASSSSVTFGYTINSAQSATFRLNNDACIPSTACNLDVSTLLGNSWKSSGVTYQSVQLSIKNNGPSTAANAKAQISFYGGSYVSSSYNIAPTTSLQGESAKNFTCALYNLQAGQTSVACGYTLASTTVLPVNQEVHLVQGICL